MIKADVNVVGTIKKGASIRTNKEGQPYLSLVMKVSLPETKGKGKAKDVEILVTIPDGKQSDLSLYSEKRRASVEGTMDIRKKGEELAFYLTASQVSTEDVADVDAISGTLHFRGRLKNDNVLEERTDRKGNPYLTFSAYSSEKVGDNFVSTWVHFVRFPEKDADIDSIKADWMCAKARVTVEGALQISVYNKVVRLSCRVSSMEEYIKE